MNETNNAERKTVYLDEELTKRCEILFGEADVSSFSQFVTKALETYIDRLICENHSPFITEELVKATALLKDIRKNHNESLEGTNRILTYESQGDTLYRSEMSSLFKTEKDPITLVKWKDILQCLEDTLDQTKHISDTLKGVVMKYA